MNGVGRDFLIRLSDARVTCKLVFVVFLFAELAYCVRACFTNIRHFHSDGYKIIQETYKPDSLTVSATRVVHMFAHRFEFAIVSKIIPRTLTISSYHLCDTCIFAYFLPLYNVVEPGKISFDKFTRQNEASQIWPVVCQNFPTFLRKS